MANGKRNVYRWGRYGAPRADNSYSNGNDDCVPARLWNMEEWGCIIPKNPEKCVTRSHDRRTEIVESVRDIVERKRQRERGSNMISSHIRIYVPSGSASADSHRRRLCLKDDDEVLH